MPVVTIIQTFGDLYIDSSQPTTNYNSSPVLWVGKQTDDTIYHSLVKFDLSFIPASSSIISSNINLYMDYDASEVGTIASITPYAITDVWNVSTVSWNNQPALNNAIAGSAANVSDPGYYSWTITNLIDAWVNGSLANNGLELKTSETALSENKRFVSSNETAPEKQAFKPVLVIQYEPGTLTPSNMSSVIVGHDVDAGQEIVTTSDDFQSTIARDTSQKTRVNFYIYNAGINTAIVGIEVSADGVNYSQEASRLLPGGLLEIYVPSYYAAYTRMYYKSNSPGQSATLTINYLAQA